jgi:hypothetical protein
MRRRESIRQFKGFRDYSAKGGLFRHIGQPVPPA